MTVFQQEEQWFGSLMQHMQQELSLTVSTNYSPPCFPCLYMEKGRSHAPWDRLKVELLFSLLTDYEGEQQESLWLARLRTLLNRPILLPQGKTLIREEKQTRKIMDRKRQITLICQAFVQLTRS